MGLPSAASSGQWHAFWSSSVVYGHVALCSAIGTAVRSVTLRWSSSWKKFWHSSRDKLALTIVRLSSYLFSIAVRFPAR